MSGFVVDCSVALAWCFHDEATDRTRAVLRRLDSEEAVVPAIWFVEMANVLALAERKRRITVARVSEFIAMLLGLPIAPDDQAPGETLRNTVDLCRAHKLTAYDAAYLELAMRRGLPLATKDEDLRSAARSAGVTLIDA